MRKNNSHKNLFNVFLCLFFFSNCAFANRSTTPPGMKLVYEGKNSPPDFSVLATSASVTVRTVAESAPLRIYASNPGRWDYGSNRTTALAQMTHVLKCNGVSFLREQNGVFLIYQKHLFALDSDAANSVKEHWFSGDSFTVDRNQLFINGQSVGEIVPTGKTCEDIQDSVLIDLPKSVNGRLALRASYDSKIELPDWSGHELSIDTFGHGIVNTQNIKLTQSAKVLQVGQSEVKIQRIDTPELKLMARDGLIDINGGHAERGDATVAAKTGGSIRLKGDFNNMNQSIMGPGKILIQ